jgi:hypothetical protein
MSAEPPQSADAHRESDCEPVYHGSYERDVTGVLRGIENVAVETLATVRHAGNSYPLYCVRSPAKPVPQRPAVLISGGVHGNEPAGVYAALHFLKEHAASLSADFNIYVLPCVNPSGFEAATLETLAGVNLNRQFGTGSTQPEVSAVESWLAHENPRLRVAFDLHEIPPDYVGEGFVQSDNPRACYLYETVSDGSPRIGRELIASLPQEIEVCRWPKIYLDDNEGGVVSYPYASHNPVSQKNTTLDAFLNGRYTFHSFTTETPTVWPIEKRVRTQITWLMRSLTLIRE